MLVKTKENSLLLVVSFILMQNTPVAACEKYQVREIQKILNQSGQQAGKPDGIWGPKTDIALKASRVAVPKILSERTCDELISSLLSLLHQTKINDGFYTSTDTFHTYTTRSQKIIRYLYPANIDSDPEQELIIAGFQSQGISDPSPKPTIVNIFDWNEYGYLTKRDDLFSNVAEQVFGGVGDVALGDFNGDGRVDIFLSGYTDTNYEVPVYSLYGGLNKFSKIKVDSASWQHGAAAADFNGDGFDDVIAAGYHTSAAIYMGSSDGLIRCTWSADSYPNGSGVTAIDLDNDGQIEVVISDNSKATESYNRDTNIYRLTINEGSRSAKLSRVASLPMPELEKPFWQTYFSTRKRKSHDIRVKSKDINSDGLNDLILFSVARNAYKGLDRNLSSVQIFINNGSLSFSDQTDNWLVGYRNRTNVAYSPVFEDLNEDGFPDLYSSEHDYDGFANSLQIFLSKNGSRLIGVPELWVSEILPASSNHEISTILVGKEEKNFIVRHVIVPGFNSNEFLAYRPISFR